MTKSQMEVWGAPKIMHLGTGMGFPTNFQPMIRVAIKAQTFCLLIRTKLLKKPLFLRSEKYPVHISYSVICSMFPAVARATDRYRHGSLCRYSRYGICPRI